MSARLRVENGPARGAEFPLSGRIIFNIGSDPGATVRLDDPAVAPSHCRLYREDSRFTLFDVSGRGLTVNGKRVVKAVLQPGDVIQLGNSELVFEAQDPAAPPAPPPPPAAVPAPPSFSGPAHALPPPGAAPGGGTASGDFRMDVRGGARAGIVRAWLQAVEGNDKGKVFDLSEGNVWVIGRGHSADVTVMDIKASRAHCRLERIGDSFYLQDLNSTNGTYVNGQQIERQLLSRGDYIKVGYTILTFQYETAEEAQGAAGMAGMPAGAPFVPLPAGGPPPPPVVPPPPFAGGLGIPAPAIPAPGYPPLPPPAPGGALPLPPAPGAGAPGAEPWPAAAGMPALPPHPSSARTDAHEPASWWPQPQLPPPPACPPPARPPGGVPAGTPAAAPPLDLDLDLSALEGDDDPFATPQGTATWQGEAERVAPPSPGGTAGGGALFCQLCRRPLTEEEVRQGRLRRVHDRVYCLGCVQGL